MQHKCRQCTAQSFESWTGQNDQPRHHHGIALSKDTKAQIQIKTQNMNMSPSTNTTGQNYQPSHNCVIAL